ncbi:MAG: hemerythrin domain-containing protein [Verrucomicrobiota bacterium]
MADLVYSFVVMNLQLHRDQIKSITRADHEILSHGVASFRKLFKGERSLRADHEFANIYRLLNERIAQHLTYEDKDVFPVLLASRLNAETDGLIANLKQEHAALRDELHNVNTLLGQRGLNQLTSKISLALLNFFNHLQDHVDKEDRLLAGLR